mgnify:CR=1 FL=1
MSPAEDGGAVLCAICSTRLHLAWSCHGAHPDHCHDCWALSPSQGYDAREHLLPTPSALTLSPRDVAALRLYQRHRARVEEDTP